MAYTKIQEHQVPHDVKWELPGHEQGQIVQTEESVNHTIYRNTDKGIRELSVYHRVTDRSDRSVTYYRLESHEIELPMRCKAFSTESARTYQVKVDDVTGSVTVYDSVAGHYTNCHSLGEAAIRRARKLASPVR